MVTVRKLVWRMVYQLLRLAGVLLDWLDRRTMIDEPITEGDPGARYLPPPGPPVLKIIHGGAESSHHRSDGDSDSCPLSATQSDERLSGDHPDTPWGVRP